MEHQVAANLVGMIRETFWPMVVLRLQKQLRSVDRARCQHKYFGLDLDLLIALSHDRTRYAIRSGFKSHYFAASHDRWFFLGLREPSRDVCPTVSRTHPPEP